MIVIFDSFRSFLLLPQCTYFMIGSCIISAFTVMLFRLSVNYRYRDIVLLILFLTYGIGLKVEEEVNGEIYFRGKKKKIFGRVDIFNRFVLVELKTISDIKLASSAMYSYNYDAQAYFYKVLTGVSRVYFLFRDRDGGILLIKVTSSHLESGKRKVCSQMEQAL